MIRSIQILGHREACQNIYVVDRQGGPQTVHNEEVVATKRPKLSSDSFETS